MTARRRSAKVLALAVASELAEPDGPVGIVDRLPISTFRQKADELARLLRDRHRFTAIGRRLAQPRCSRSATSR